MINKKLLKPIQNKGATKPDTSAKAHDTLLNRDKAEQHPISAITDLQTTLDAKQAKLTAIDAKLVINTNNITKNADDILLKADKTEITALDTKLTLNTNNISDNTADILLKADKTELVNKQDKLTAGTNISIVGDVISSTGGGGGGGTPTNMVTTDTAQTITGIKTFTNGINNNFIEVDGKSLIIKNSKTASSYLEVESVYSGSGYKNWFGLNFIRTTGTSRSKLAILEIRQDDGLYIDCVNDVSIQGSNIKFNNVRLQQVGAPTADYDAATKKYVDDVISASGVTLDTAQTITGIKTFENGIKIDGVTIINGNTNIITGTTHARGKLLVDGTIWISDKNIIGLATPTADDHAATKRYVDVAIAVALKPYKKFIEKLMKEKNYDK